MFLSKEDVAISFSLDDTFTGIMQGMPDDEGEGCILSGHCVLNVKHPIKVCRLIVTFEGCCKVYLKTVNSVGMSIVSGTSETRSLFSRQQEFIGQDGEIHNIPPGIHSYRFSFDLPSFLPASFEGSRGSQRYLLTCAIYRSMFSTDLRHSMDIPIKRCLMADLESLSHSISTIHGTKHTDKIQYYGTAPTMTYREGGLIRLELYIQLQQPDYYSMKSITWGIRERVQYRTTDSQSRVMASHSDDTYPLGYNTIYPDQTSDYDPTKHQNYDAVLRLIPRVNADTSSRLIQVSHSLVVNILLQRFYGDDQTVEEAQRHELTNEAAEYTSGSPEQIDNNKQPQQERIRSLSASASPSSSSLYGRSLSSPSLTSFFSLKNKSHAESHLLKGKTTRAQGKQQRHRRSSITVCSLELPIVITSRHTTWKDQKPDVPPSYRQTASDSPPVYLQTLETCPAVSTSGSSNSGSNTITNDFLDGQEQH
ncbi:hypothetical protein BCR42DRAFT_446588 [Absidia repens]|uniref:Arrestin-like N-terminal domain-containing protein n=1 Tax=Absidia repens TaxID=90262 RepID=A0A1X2IZA3_9FUNG|nr:hypothetical protein BCR42DRAFT_446588 [Absidia repens]